MVSPCDWQKTAPLSRLSISNTDKTTYLAAQIKEAGRKATTFKADVSDRAQVYAAVEHAEKTFGGLEIMVNKAGIAQIDPIADVIPQDIELTLKTRSC